MPARLKTREIHLRDPFVFVDRKNNEYLLFGTTFPDGIGTIEPHFSVYKSKDLLYWEEPSIAFQPPKEFWGVRHYWAPEVHMINNGYYLFFSAKGGIGEKRGTGILSAENPKGPYRDYSEGPVTPSNWESLDGTFYRDKKGDNWLIFCHEWTQIGDGTIHAMQLSSDLKNSIGNPVEIVRASSAEWVRPFEDVRTSQKGYLTDAPFMYETKDGNLLLLWSSYSNEEKYNGGYTVACMRSESGSVEGPWKETGLLLDNNSGHPSIFLDLEGRLRLCCHYPDTPHGSEAPVFYFLEDEGDRLTIVF